MEKQITEPGNYFGEMSIESIVSQDGVRTYRVKHGNNFYYLSNEQIERIYRYQQEINHGTATSKATE